MNRKSTHSLIPTTLLTCPFMQPGPLIAAAALFLLIGSLPSAGQGGLLLPTIQNVSVVQVTNTSTMNMWVPTQAGVNYTAQFRSLPSTGFWSELTNFAGSGSSDPLSDNITGVPQRFYRVAVDPRPWVRSQPRSRNPYAGETVQLDVTATGRLPLAYQWNGPSGPLSDGSRVSGSTTPHLVIANVDPSDVGNYWASVTNLYGSTSCVPAGVRITLSQSPRILIDPQTQSLLVGQNVSLWSTASGVQPLYYMWYGPAGQLADDARTAGSATTNLAIAGLQVIDDGGYFMVVSNSFGSATSAVATVRVQLGQAPRINADPSSQTVIAGQTANLSVVATGTGTLNYEWHGPSGILSNGGKISGATTANLAISNFQATENGDYYVVVSNTFGSATSGTANIRAQ
jgi:hypothetical protein